MSDPDMFLEACAAAAFFSLLAIVAWLRPSPRAILRRVARFVRAVLPPPVSAAFTRGHRVLWHDPWPVIGPRGGYAELVLELQHCRCGAWRARVAWRGCELHTRWSAPCSVPSPALPPSDEPR